LSLCQRNQDRMDVPVLSCTVHRKTNAMQEEEDIYILVSLQFRIHTVAVHWPDPFEYAIQEKRPYQLLLIAMMVIPFIGRNPFDYEIREKKTVSTTRMRTVSVNNCCGCVCDVVDCFVLCGCSGLFLASLHSILSSDVPTQPIDSRVLLLSFPFAVLSLPLLCPSTFLYIHIRTQPIFTDSSSCYDFALHGLPIT